MPVLPLPPQSSFCNYCKHRGDLTVPSQAFHHLCLQLALHCSALIVLLDTAHAQPAPALHRANFSWTLVSLVVEWWWIDLYFWISSAWHSIWHIEGKWINKYLTFLSLSFLVQEKRIGSPILVHGSFSFFFLRFLKCGPFLKSLLNLLQYCFCCLCFGVFWPWDM